MSEIFKSPELPVALALTVFFALILGQVKRILRICAGLLCRKGDIKMLRITLKIDGMRCGMCEAHLCDAIRAAHRVQKVTSSHRKGVCVILTGSDIPDDALRKTVSATGYTLLSLSREPYCRKGLFARFRRRSVSEKNS